MFKRHRYLNLKRFRDFIKKNYCILCITSYGCCQLVTLLNLSHIKSSPFEPYSPLSYTNTFILVTNMFSFRVEKNAQSRIDQIAEVIAELKDPMTVEPAKVGNQLFSGVHIYF